MRLDAHLHVWWPGDGAAVRIRAALPELDRDFSFASMRGMLLAARVERAVLVSAAQQADDNERLLAVADANRGLVAGVIGWIDAEAEDAEAQLRRLGSAPAWRGFRLPLTIHPDRRFVRRPAVGAALRALRAIGGIAEVLAAPDQLPDVAAVLRDLPGLVAIIDHAGNPDFSAPPTDAWRGGIAALAALPDVVCKVSNFWAPGDPPVRDDVALGFYREIVARFGPARIIAGGNWPPASLAGPYAASWERLDRLAAAADLDAGDAEAVRFGTAARLFRVSRR
jgi:L-fuconolactonase